MKESNENLKYEVKILNQELMRLKSGKNESEKA
jgi:hypothetical protein